MIKYIQLIFLFCFILSLNINAKSTPDKGLYGSLNFLYYDENIETKYKYNVQDFTKELKLGYMGNLYSPKLLTYKLDSTLSYQDIRNKYQNTKYNLESETLDYNLNLAFLKESRFPFTYYKNKSDNPITKFDYSDSYQFIYKSENSGLNGSIKLNDLNINYNFAQNNISSQAQEYLNNTDQEIYTTSLRYYKKNHKFNINYQHLDRQNSMVSNDPLVNNENSSQVDDSLMFKYNSNISKSLTFDSSASYFTSEYLQYENETSYLDLNLNWKPDNDYRGNIYFRSSRLKTQYDTNEDNSTTIVNQTFDTFNFSQNFGYAYTKNLNFSQNLSEYLYDSDTSKGLITNFQLRVNHKYQNTAIKDSIFLIKSSADYQKLINTKEDKILNIEDNTNTNIYTLSLVPGLTTDFSKINTTSYLGADFYDTHSSNNEYTQRYGLSLKLNSKFLYIARNNFTSYVSKTNTNIKWDRFNDNNETIIITNSSSVTTKRLTDTVNVSFRLRNKGTINCKTGVNYSKTSSKENSIEYTKILGEMILKYRFTRKLNFTADIYADKDVTNKLNTGRGKVLISYMAGKTNISAGYNYYKTLADNDSSFQTWSRSRLSAKLTRKF